ncbi:nucleotidyltransferase family protein [Amedibacillus dolichus]|uniref:nucleotidyltransferase family protein n=1 Tax=Amedibacillus dolichus TaxID=31971 RepID=UPI0039A225F3
MEKASENDKFNNLPIYSQLAFETMPVVAGQARRTEAFLSLYKQFLKEGIHPILMKGLICRQLYGEYCDHRSSGDEDILIRNSDYKTVFHILEQNGYVPEEKCE